MRLDEAVATGDLRQSLEALRDVLSQEIAEGASCAKCGGAMSSPTAGLARQLTDVLVKLAGLPKPKASAVDELANQRAARRGASPSDSSTKGGQRGSGGRGSGRVSGAGS